MKKTSKIIILGGLLTLLAYLTLTKSGRAFAAKLGIKIMDISQAGISAIAGHEGFSAKPYNDPPGSTKWSIGFGHQLQPGETFTTVTIPQAMEILKRDTANANATVKRLIRVPLTVAQHDALVSFVFNIGSYAFETGSVPSKINAQNFIGAAATMRLYNKAGGQINNALIARRATESAAFA